MSGDELCFVGAGRLAAGGPTGGLVAGGPGMGT